MPLHHPAQLSSFRLAPCEIENSGAMKTSSRITRVRLWLEPESLELAIQALNHSQGALLFDGAGEPIGRLLPLVQEGQQAVEVN